jgi:serine/threonine protein kinase
MEALHQLHQPGDTIADRYEINYFLGCGATGKTYAATDLSNGDRVAIKEMSMRRAKEWKELDVFEREARVLSLLDHPAIPNYLNYFEIDSDTNRYFYIVQELAVGKSLAEMVGSGWRTDEAGVKAIAKQILEILVYLHRLTPPVIHRDIKPEHAIRREDGQIYLVDFGSVRSAFWSTNSSGATVVGTFGYMAPEQDRGQVYPASDLYGLGSTLVFLLTHRSPAELPQRRLKIDFRSHVQISEPFADWLDLMLEPMVEDRFHSALQALRALPE